MQPTLSAIDATNSPNQGSRGQGSRAWQAISTAALLILGVCLPAQGWDAQTRELLVQFYLGKIDGRLIDEPQVVKELEARGLSPADLTFNRSAAEWESQRLFKRKGYQVSGVESFLQLMRLSEYEDGQRLAVPADFWSRYSLEGALRPKIANRFELRFNHHSEFPGDGVTLWDDDRLNYTAFADGRYFLTLWYRDRPQAWTSFYPLNAKQMLAVDLHTLNAYRYDDEDRSQLLFAHAPSILEKMDWQRLLLEAGHGVAAYLGFEDYLLQSGKNNEGFHQKPDIEFEAYYDGQAERLNYAVHPSGDYVVHPKDADGCHAYMKLLKAR